MTQSRHRLAALLAICAAAFALRLAMLGLFVHTPNIADPNHYYNLGVRLVEGHGFTINYIWQYNDLYPAIEHPDDYWMPFAGVIAAGGMTIFGVTVTGAMIPFVVLGGLLPVIGYLAARQFDLRESTALWCAAASSCLPEMVMNSLRTDTTVPNAIVVGVALIAFVHGLRTPRPWARVLSYAISGAAVGIAYLIRSEGVLIVPAVFAAGIAAAFLDRTSFRLRPFVIGMVVMGAAAALVALPWVIRNLNVLGSLATPMTGNMFFLTDHNDHYLFNTHLSLQTYLASQTPAQIIGKRLFELAATGKLVITTLDVLFLPAFGGVLLLMGMRGDASAKRRWIAIAPTLILLGAFIIFYPILVPYKSQGGSMKKALLSLLPMLVPFAGFALERAIAPGRIRTGAMVLSVALLTINGVELTRQDQLRSDTYYRTMTRVADAARALPDVNGDGQITLMSQDPYILDVFDIPSVMFPQGDPDTVVEIVRRYGIDYLLMPPDRTGLNGLISGEIQDPRFIRVETLPGTTYEFWRVDLTATQEPTPPAAEGAS
ncbi:MAG: glycosyltransferase family 39 protein [Anaerolineae bacterium]